MARSAYLIHKHRYKKTSKRKQIQGFDRVVLISSFVYPLSGIPQIIAVWQGDGKVSVVTWVLFLLFGFVSLAYGFIHKLTPIIVNNLMWTVIDLFVIVGALRS